MAKENRFMWKRNAWIAGLVAAMCVAGTGSIAMLSRSAVAATSEAEVEQDVGGGAPTRVISENDSIRVTLVSYPAGFKREGGKRRRLEQLIVYVDDGAFKVIPRPGATPNPNAGKRGPESSITLEGEVAKGGFHPKGTTAWHPKDSLTPTIVTSRAYRALYIEFKR